MLLTTAEEKDAGIFSLKVAAVVSCGKCLAIIRCSSSCLSGSNNYNINCSDNFTFPYNNGDTKLPADCLLICGVIHIHVFHIYLPTLLGRVRTGDWIFLRMTDCLYAPET